MTSETDDLHATRTRISLVSAEERCIWIDVFLSESAGDSERRQRATQYADDAVLAYRLRQPKAALELASGDELDSIGAKQRLPRLSDETDSDYRVRLKSKRAEAEVDDRDWRDSFLAALAAGHSPEYAEQRASEAAAILSKRRSKVGKS